MPPLEGEGDEAMFFHDRLQFEAIGPLFFGPFGGETMRLFGEVIEGGGHRQFVSHPIDQGDVDGRASSMLAFAYGGIGNVTFIPNELPHLELNRTWPIAVENFQAETFLP